MTVRACMRRRTRDSFVSGTRPIATRARGLYDAAMRWLLHGSLTPAVAEALRRRGDTPVTSQEAGLSAEGTPDKVLKAAHGRQLDLMTNDASLVTHVVERGADFGRSIAYLQVEGGDVEQDDAVDRLFQRYKRLTPGRLYTVTASRVKIRQIPGPRPT